MMIKIFLIVSLLFMAFPLSAQTYGAPDTNLQEYFDESSANEDKSIIYVFFNNEPCYTCAQTIGLIEQIYNRNFADRYNLLLINYANDQENQFIYDYNLRDPLAVVLVRINDGASFGWKKLTGLQDMISDPISFEEYLIKEINTFLSNY